LVPGLRGLPVTGFRQHYFLGHDLVRLVGSSNLTQQLSRLLKAVFDQIAAREIEDYYAAKPGLTGRWQVSGRSDMSYARRVQLDVGYVRNWFLWHDIAILFKTIPAVFF
jgi:hypothetical protein